MRSRNRRIAHRHRRQITTGDVIALLFAAALLILLASGSRTQTVRSNGDVVVSDSVTPAMLALGDSVFHGQASAGMCMSCHGDRGRGTPRAPSLSDREWLTGDGDIESILSVIRRGVLRPKLHSGSMPGYDGAMQEQQLRAVAAYVYSLSNRYASTRAATFE